MNGARNLVSLALKDPTRLPGWPLDDWDLLVRQARSANLLARLAVAIDEHGLWQAIPAGPRLHLSGARMLPRRQAQALKWEVRKILEALSPLPLILLKGTAYLMADLPPARGRLFSDIDILVPREALPRVEAALMMHGWHGSHHNAYDQRYYRRWMHELPPMRHIQRASVIDVHHAIVPITSRLKTDAAKLIAAAQPIDATGRLSVLAPADMVLHSAVHLFSDGELAHGLRDLVDLDELLNHFGRDGDFWSRLAARAEELGLARPLYYALRYAQRLCATPVPGEVLRAADAAGPRPPLRGAMDALFMRALNPDHGSAADGFTALARKLLYIRSHWLRMPLPLLLVHLAIKSVRGEEEEGA